VGRVGSLGKIGLGGDCAATGTEMKVSPHNVVAVKVAIASNNVLGNW
jgi:hypothetical protein